MMTTCLKKKEIDSNKSIHLNRYIDWSMSVWFELAMLRVGCEGFPCQHKRSKRFWICRPKVLKLVGVEIFHGQCQIVGSLLKRTLLSNSGYMSFQRIVG
jgi:hypothetical protein